MKKKKVLLLTLGTGDASYQRLTPDTVSKLPGNKTILQSYKDTDYFFNGKVIHSSMVAYPIMKELKSDIVFFIGTVRSTWTSLYSTFVSDDKRSEEAIRELLILERSHGKDTTETELATIQSRIQDIFEGADVFSAEGIEKTKIILIKYGLTETELQYNYQRLNEIGDYMQERDTEYEVSFDITHSFRSMPIYNLAILNYIKTLSASKIQIARVLYGMRDVREENNSSSPILDLSDIITVMDLTAAVSEFRNTGCVRSLYPFVPANDKKLMSLLDEFDWATQTNDLNTMQTSIIALRENLQKQDTSPRYTDLCEMLISVLDEQFPSESEFNDIKEISQKPWALGNVQLKIGKVFLNQNRYGQAILAGTEAIVSLMIPYYLYAKECSVDEFSCRSWANRDKVNLTKLIKKNLVGEPYEKLLSEIHDLYFDLKNDRNMFAHIGESHRMKPVQEEDTKRDVSKSKENIYLYFEKMEKLILAFQNDYDQINRLFCLMFNKKKEEIDHAENAESVNTEQKAAAKKEKTDPVSFEAQSPNLSEKTIHRLKNRKLREATVVGISKKKTIMAVLKDGRLVDIPKLYVTKHMEIAVGDKISVKLIGDEKDEHPKGFIGY